MARSNVELYEAPKGSIPEDAARMIAEVVPPAKDLAMKTDLFGVREEIGSVRAEIGSVRAEIGSVRAEVRALPTMKWVVALFIPVWLGTWSSVVAVILKG
ncbi:MAG: hypothetical protein ACRDKJ_04705 [Actinomycetota bacterium]